MVILVSFYVNIHIFVELFIMYNLFSFQYIFYYHFPYASLDDNSAALSIYGISKVSHFYLYYENTHTVYKPSQALQASLLQIFFTSLDINVSFISNKKYMVQRSMNGY